MRRTLPLLVTVAAFAALLLPAAMTGATAQVTGTMTIREDVTLSPDAVAVFTIVDQNASNKAGGIVGFQRINNAATPVAFSVAYDTASIDPKESYAIFGSIIDGSTVYQTFEPVPVITGGPTSDVALVATAEVPAGAGAVTGTIEIPGNTSLSVERGRRRGADRRDDRDAPSPGRSSRRPATRRSRSRSPSTRA